MVMQTMIGPKTARMQTVFIHGPKRLHEKVRRLGRDVPGALHLATSFSYPSVDSAREAFAAHTSPIFNRMSEPDISTPYGRFGNPNTAELEAKFNYAHGLNETDGYSTLTFGSGMAANSIAMILATDPGDTVIYDNDLYGCTGRGAGKFYRKKLGRNTVVMDIQDTEGGYRELRGKITPKTRAVFVETQTNPHLKLNNIKKLARLLHEINAEEKRGRSNRLRLIVDNTFMGPLFCRPVELAREAVPEDPEMVIVTESLTKIVSGFGLDIAGAVLAPNSLVYDENWEEEGLIAHRDILGGILHPFSAFEISNRSLPTYINRAKTAEQSAMTFAQFLETTRGKWVSDVTYPGLDSYPQRPLALEMLHDYDGYLSFGYMIGFNFHGGLKTQERAAVRFMNYIAQKGYAWNFMVSLGQVRSLAEVPAAMTHYGSGMPMFARISVGTESPEDLIEEASAAFRFAYLPPSKGGN